MQSRNVLHDVKPEPRTRLTHRATAPEILLKNTSDLINRDAIAGVLDFNLDSAVRLSAERLRRTIITRGSRQ